MLLRIVLIEREPGYWVGQCVDYDIGAQASSLPDLLYNMERSLVGHVAICTQKGVEPFSDLPKPPDEYVDLWDRARVHVKTDEKFDGLAGVESELKVA